MLFASFLEKEELFRNRLLMSFRLVQLVCMFNSTVN
jgi:hypothetical protein